MSPASSTGWTAASAGGSAKIGHPPPASTDGHPITSRSSARTRLAAGASQPSPFGEFTVYVVPIAVAVVVVMVLVVLLLNR